MFLIVQFWNRSWDYLDSTVSSYFEARALLVTELKAVFENANMDVPDFLLFMEEHPDRHFCVTCGCGEDFPSIRECEGCCPPAVDEVEEPRTVSSEDLEDSDELMKEVLRAMLLHGVNQTSKVLEELSSSSTTPSFSTEPMILSRLLFPPASSRKPFHAFCARLGIVVGSGENRLVDCKGARSGCPCNLHDIELDE